MHGQKNIKITKLISLTKFLKVTVVYSGNNQIEFQRPHLPTHRTCRGGVLHLITLNDTHTHTQANTLSRTPLDEGSNRRRDLYLTTHNIHNRHPRHLRNSNPKPQQASGSRPMP